MSVTDLINKFIDLGQSLIPFLTVLAFFVFVWGVGRFIKSTSDEKDIQSKKNFLIWGVVGLFVMMSIWGVVAFVTGELGFGTDPKIPQLPTNY